MQVTENFYNVLWWSKNARQYRFGSPHPWPGPGYQRDITTSRRQQKILLSTAYTILSLWEQLLRMQALISREPRSVSVMSRWYLGPGREWGLPSLYWRAFSLHHKHCKIFLSLASPFLICCNAPIFFSHFIFFSLLCCYRLHRWHCSWSTFRYILHLGL